MSAAVGEGVKEGCGDDIIDTDPYLPSIRSQTRAVFGFFHPETWFQKSAFSGSAFAGFVWTVGPNDAKHVRLHKKTFPCGRPLKQVCVTTSVCFCVKDIHKRELQSKHSLSMLKSSHICISRPLFVQLIIVK